MATYKVCSIDAWGNQEDGWDVNAVYTTSYTIEVDDINDDQAIVDALKEKSLLVDDITTEDVDIDGDEFMLYVNDRETQEPIWQLHLMS